MENSLGNEQYHCHAASDTMRPYGIACVSIASGTQNEHYHVICNQTTAMGVYGARMQSSHDRTFQRKHRIYRCSRRR